MIRQKFKSPAISFHSVYHSVSGIFSAVILFVLLLFTNLTQMTSVIFLPFSRIWFRKINRFCDNSWWGACVIVMQRLHGTHLVITGDSVPLRENAIVVANHQQMPDILALMIFARTKERLGDLKWFVKDVIKYVPGVGWGMYFLDCIYVKRNWESDRNKIKAIFSKFLEDRIPIWLISFVEGTRLTQAKLQRSQKYAKENHLPVFSHVMLPRTKGFVASVAGLKGHLQAVYDVTVGYPEGVPTLTQVIQGAATQIHIHMRRFPIQELPDDASALSAWLIQRFWEKDQLLEYFYKTGSFPSDRTMIQPDLKGEVAAL